MILAETGYGLLLAAVVLAASATLISFWSGARGAANLAWVGRRALYATTALLVLASGCLVAALLSHDFTIAFVAEHSDRSLPTALLVASFYGGQEGSLLYWTLVLGVIGSAAASAASGVDVRLAAYAAAVISFVLTFFLLVMVFVADPFGVLAVTPSDGLGLNPLLRDGGMLIHPPFLLAGFASFGVPCAFVVAALLAGRQNPTWIALTRRFALLAWGLQSVGLVLGMWWAYHVLGWGGYWGWDPVENLALLPWLASTAYIHSAQVQERRGQLKVWNLGLVMGSFFLSILGTFVVRSGVLLSVHTFAVGGSLGIWFFAFTALTLIGAGALLALRSANLRSDHPLESMVSREGAFVFQNFLLVGILASILWGVLLPLTSGFVGGGQRVLGTAYYDHSAGPLLLVLFALLAVGPLLPWRRAGHHWRRQLWWPAMAASAAAAILLVTGTRQPIPIVAVSIVVAAGASSILEFVRGGRYAAHLAGPWPVAAWRLVSRNRRRYCAYVAHVGIVVLAIGIVASHFWQQELAVVLRPGQTFQVASYNISLLGVATAPEGDHSAVTASLRVNDETVQPARLIYPVLGGQAISRIAIRSTVVEDLYVVLVATGSDGSATLRVFVNPLVTWIWAGAGLLVFGALAGQLAGPRTERATVPASLGAQVTAQ